MISTIFHEPQLGAVDIQVHLPAGVFSVAKFTRRLPATCRKIGREGLRYWKREASQRLNTSREAYLAGLSIDFFDDATFILGLEGFIPMMIEGGVDRFDMKPGFLNSPKAKHGPPKLPRAVAASLPDKPKGVRKHMVVPFTNNSPIEFRTVTDKSPPDSWIWKRRKMGLKIAPDVWDELQTHIIPKHVRALMRDTL